ncbi:MAG: HEAT repeat domain-containing protein [Pirellulales bacterium]
MRLLSARTAFVLVAAIAMHPMWIAEAHAQRRSTTPARQPARGVQTASRPPAAGQRSGQGTLPAQLYPGASQAQGQTAPARPPVIEKADAKTRGEFLKLLGANWIWSPAHQKDEVPVGDCYFRKAFTLGKVEMGQVHVACDNQYELYVNGKLVGRGSDWRKMDVHDITKLLVTGPNVIAIKGTNIDAGAAGLAARVIIKQVGGTYENYSTDASWRTSTKQFANWTQPNVRDTVWLPAKVYGPLGGALPWGDEVVIAEEGARFLVDQEFSVERIITDEQAGSLIAMTFNASGDILASREGGGIVLIRDTNRDGKPETVTTYCDQVKNVQGMLSLGTRVYAVGEGPQGGAVYQIVDQNNDGRSDSVSPILKFRGAIGEHGPHTVRLGPDGMLYVLCGNFAQVDARPDPQSPYSISYEGDLVQPRYEDPQGYAVGVPAPGGTILRTDTSGSFVEIVAGGLRNPYDIGFDRDGELFTYDADMEWDIGAPWYRPTRVNHVPAGAEFGWRSGWAKWPEHYIDSLPATFDVGAGSPTGVAFYEHYAFPERLQRTMFVGDWALGQIHAVKLERSGASYTAKISTLLKGRPLNVTGLDVGPDGALYFCTGGRGTDGGVYRIRWNGKVPSEATLLGQGIQPALRQPQFYSDWARMRIAGVKQRLGERWQTELLRILGEGGASSSDRLRAVDLLTFFGPSPSPELLVALARDQNPAMRAKVARLMGVRNDAAFTRPLENMLADSDPWVRRVSCEAIAHRGSEAPVDLLFGLLADRDRYVAFAARRSLERIPAEQWQERVLSAKDTQTFLEGATGLLAAYPSPQTAQRVLSRCETMLRGNQVAASRESAKDQLRQGVVTSNNYLDLLRVTQLALIRGPIPPRDAAGISREILADYPAADAIANRELIKLLAYLQPPEAAHELAVQLAGDLPDVEKLQIAAYAPRITSNWSTDDKLVMLRYYEQVRDIEGGHSIDGYIEAFARDFFATLTLAERRQVLAAGENFPTSSLSVLAKLPENPGPEVLGEIRALDGRLDGKPGEAIARLRVGITAVLGQSGDAGSLEYLRNIYLNVPQRRAPVAMSLTQHPDGENWPILVDSLRTIDGVPAQDVLAALAKVNRRPETSEPYRSAILLGLRLQNSGGDAAVRLLTHWTGRQLSPSTAPVADQLASWQKWYASTFPKELPAELPKESQPNKWSYEELVSYLDSVEGKAGIPTRGAVVFKDALCMNCHRFAGRGESLGPDLTTVANRFQPKEILESIVYPSQVVSDQYASQIVVANGRTYTGVAVRNADGSMTVLPADGKKVQLPAEDIEEVRSSKLSAMPEGLMNPLSLEQVADLFAYLMKGSDSDVAGRGPETRR